jgi:hypothetical protein
MAKRSNEPISGADRAKVRVIFAEVEGNNESVQEALRTMVSAMSRPVRVISEQKTNGKTSTLLQQTDVDEVEDTVDQAEEAESMGEDQLTQNTRAPRGSGKKTDRNAGIELVPNLNFRPNEKQALKDFMEEKGPKNDVEAVLTTLYYMQHVMALQKIGPAHLRTAFKEAGKGIPVDLKQTIRNIKKSKMWLNFTDIEDLRTTTQGDNFVEHEMNVGE